MIAFEEKSRPLARIPGSICHFPTSQNRHERILARSVALAPVAPVLAEAAQTAAEALADAVDLVGLLAGVLYRPMAGCCSTKWRCAAQFLPLTIEGCATSHHAARPRPRHGFWRHVDLWQVADGQSAWPAHGRCALNPGAQGTHLHLLLPEARTDRKMGHVTRRLIDQLSASTSVVRSKGVA